MILQGLIAALSRASTFENALGYAARHADFSLTEGLNAPLLAALLSRRGQNGHAQALFVITATGRESEALRENLGCFAADTANPAEIIDMPAWETLPHERLSPSAEIVGRRLHALRRMREWEETPSAERAPLIVVASVRAALQPVADNLTDFETIELTAGARGHDLARIALQLVDVAYSRVDMVTRRGEFAVRGGILDVFPPVAPHPFRVEFFGDEVEQIRAFSVADQRSLPEPIESVDLPPSREMLLSPAVRQRAREMQHEFPSLSGMLAKIAEGIPVDGMESLAPALVDRLVPVTDYLPAGAAVAVVSPERVATRAISLAETNREFLSAAWNAATAGAEAPIDLESGDFLTLSALRDSVTFSAPGQPASEHVWWTLSSFQAAPTDEQVLPEHRDMEDLLTVRIAADAVPSFQGSVDGAVGHLTTRLKDGWTVGIVARGAGLVERAADVLGETELPARIVDEFPADAEPGIAYLVKASVDHGFEIPESRLMLVSESEFYGRTVGYDSRQIKKLASRRKNVVDPLQLKTGDHVVHQTHGIGRFIELTQREVSSGGRNPVKTKREYLVLEYAPSKRGQPGDRLFVPTDQLDLLTRYVGGESPALSKMGGSDWSAAKNKARKAVRDIAVELVKLYSARMASRGHAFPPDTPWQRELEEAFPFAETPDQLTTIEEVKADMERPIPMDRLLSGDVGFGKTEVAVRAAFKAIQDGK
ncbi:MAG TPA: CarD family transcriptional regulator, partial [Glaciibacter sp.]|nr:CarD family transcriptional regulator [Glaciibacter sp.]